MADQEPYSRLVVDETIYQTRLTRKHRTRKGWAPLDPKRITAYIPGVIRRVYVSPGKNVDRGAPLLVLEAMKMQNTISAPHDGVIKSVAVKTGDKVARQQLLVEFE